MADFKIRLTKTGEYVAILKGGGYIAGTGNEDFVWKDEEEAKKAISVCEKHWGEMELIAA